MYNTSIRGVFVANATQGFFQFLFVVTYAVAQAVGQQQVRRYHVSTVYREAPV
jgi:hypothetical protein